MIVELTTEVARHYGVLPRGIHELSDATAAEFIRLGWAVAVESDPSPQVETAAEYLNQPRGRKDARINSSRRSERSNRTDR